MRRLDFFEQARAVPVLDVVHRYMPGLELRRTGRNWLGLCPFHQEKTPSFTVTPARQMFYCFGCGAGTSPVDFLVHLHGLEPLDAAKQICRDFGLPVDENLSPAEVRFRLEADRQERALEKALDAHKNRVYRGLCLVHQAAARVVARGPDHPAFETGAHLEIKTEYLLDVLQHGTPAEQLEVLREYGGLADV